MKILVQWSRRTPQGWEEIDSSEWAASPKRAVPTARGGQDNLPGLVFKTNIQGVESDADHYAFEDLPGGGCRSTIWNDDPDDYPPGQKFAMVRTFLPLAPDQRHGGAWNTRQSCTVFAEDEVRREFERFNWNPAELRPWSEFVAPPEEITRHGVWVSDALNAKHDAKREIRGWREWTDGVPADMVRDGKVLFNPTRTLPRLRDQRAAGLWARSEFTKTYYHSDSAVSIGFAAAEFEQELSLSPTAVATQTSAAIAGGGDSLVWAATTPATDPNEAAWPSPIASYRHQIDCSAVGTNITFGLLTVGASLGRFHRFNSGLGTSLESRSQAEAAFSGTGLHLATATGANWSAGNASDRYGIMIAAGRPASHGNQSISVDVNEADDFADGPWAAAAGRLMSSLAGAGGLVGAGGIAGQGGGLAG